MPGWMGLEQSGPVEGGGMRWDFRCCDPAVIPTMKMEIKLSKCWRTALVWLLDSSGTVCKSCKSSATSCLFPNPIITSGLALGTPAELFSPPTHCSRDSEVPLTKQGARRVWGDPGHQPGCRAKAPPGLCHPGDGQGSSWLLDNAK